MGHAFGETTVVEKLGLVPVLARGVLAAFALLLTAPVRGSAGAPTAFKHVALGVMRACLSVTTTGQQQFVNDDTDTVYQKFAKAKGFKPESIFLPNGGKGHWLGRKTAANVFVYYHGGGFVLPSSPDHMGYLYALQQDFEQQGHDVAVLYLSYTLAPQAVYPTQLTQAIELLRNLIEVQGKDPSNIIIGGDSAGGNLTLGVLSHILHPHPSGIPPLKLSSPLRAAVLISPWVSFNADTPSFTANATSDMLNSTMMTLWASTFLSSSGDQETRDNYNEATRAPKEWWTGLDKVVKDVLIWAGGGEVLLDGIKEIATTLESVHGNTTMMIVPRACHEEPLMDALLGCQKSESSKAMDGWIAAKL